MGLNVVRSAIAEELAVLERLVDVPVEPFGYGTDLSLANDLTARMEMVNAFTTRALGEAIIRRLTCPRGGLPDDADYGIDVRAMVNKGTTTDDLRALAGAIRAEATKDDRIDTVTVVVTPSSTGSDLAIALAVTPADPRIGGFTLTLALSSAALLLEEMSTP